MKHLVVVVAAAWLIACGSSASECDLSTEAGIAAAFKRATGKEVSKDHSCMQASTTFKGLVVTGIFADDRGCIGQGILVGCQISPPGFEAAAMAKAGWADLAARQDLALAWLTEIDDLRSSRPSPRSSRRTSHRFRRRPMAIRSSSNSGRSIPPGWSRSKSIASTRSCSRPMARQVRAAKAIASTFAGTDARLNMG